MPVGLRHKSRRRARMYVMTDFEQRLRNGLASGERRSDVLAMKGGETLAHAQLKRLSLVWAQENGFPIVAPEVRLPKSSYRADVAACSCGAKARTAVFECKQARADLLKDSRGEAEAKKRVAELSERRAKLEALISGHRPDLRRGESLFPEFDAWDFSGVEHATHRRVLADLAMWQQRLLHGTKFAKLFRWRAADYLYLVSEEGIFAEAEIPAGWGLLVRRDETLAVMRRPVWTEPVEDASRGLLERIAIAATRVVNREAGVRPVVGRWNAEACEREKPV